MSSPSISAFTAGNSCRAVTHAFTKKLMKPRRTPACFFSNASRYSLRNAITADISTSLKVVSIAAVFCASFSRAAMVRRRWAVKELQHVALGDAAVLAGAGADRLGADMPLLHHLGRGRQRRVAHHGRRSSGHHG